MAEADGGTQLTKLTYEAIAAGQPGPYQDSRWVCRVTFEEPVTEKQAREIIAEHPLGYTAETKETREGWWSTYLAYFRQVDDDGKIWEFKTVTPFTD